MGGIVAEGTAVEGTAAVVGSAVEVAVNGRALIRMS